MNKQPSLTIEEMIGDDIRTSVGNFIGIPKNIIEARAEQEAERWTAGNFDADNPVRDSYKQSYIQMFIEEVKNKLR